MNKGEGVQIVKMGAWSAGPGCHGGCGVDVHIKDGRVIKVEGDSTHPWYHGRACPRLLAMTQYIYHPDRLRYPLKRVGERGEGKWQRISWNEAFDICEKRMREIKDKYGPESMIFTQGTGRDCGGQITLLAYAYGSPNWCMLGLSGHSCFTPQLAAGYVTQGDFTFPDAAQFLPDRYQDPEWVPPKVVISWGSTLNRGCVDHYWSGHWFIDQMKQGAKLIVIDPRCTWEASRADLWLQIRPGTDGALALGMLNIVINENLYDKDFVDKWTFGFDELKKKVQEYPPQRAANITRLPKEDIVKAARFYATSKPAAIQWGVPIDMNPQGTVVSQAINHLWAITGNIDIPGGNVIARASHGVTSYPYTRDEMASLYGEELFTKLSEKRIGAWRYPMLKNFRAWASEDVALEQIESGVPYPIKAAWIQTNNVLSSGADPRRHYNALKKLDFIVYVDLFQNPTSMAVADIFLPAATFAEKQSLRSWWAPLSVTVKGVEVEECKSDWEINLELARRLSTTPIPYKTVKELIDSRLKVAGLTYDELAKKGGWEAPLEGPSKPYRRWERGLLRRDGKPGFNTPTGKVELWSKLYEEWGLDPLPYYEEPPESPVSTPELWKEYPLILNSGRRVPAFFHSEHRMIPWLREIEPDPTVEIHPQTAKDLGIVDGEWVYIENKRGRVKCKAKLTPTILPYVVAPTHNWWLPETEGREPYLYGIWEYNINNLVPACTQGRSGWGGGAYKTCLCKVTRIRE